MAADTDPAPSSTAPLPSPADLTASRDDEPDAAAVGFVLHLGRALHSYGEASHRLEDMLGAMSDRLGLRGAQFFTQPTSIMASFGPVERQRTHMLRVEPGDVNLGRLAAVEDVSREVAQGIITPVEGTARINRIAESPGPYGPFTTTLAFAGISGATCQLLGGGAREVGAATLLGLCVRLFSMLAGRQPRLMRVFEPLAAFLVSGAAVALAHLAGPLSVLVATLAGLIVLLPGLTLTTALRELSSRQLASGTARLSGAFITFLGLGFGVALGNRLASAAFGAPVLMDPVPLPGWASWAALLLSPIGAIIILRAAPRDALWIILGTILGAEAGRRGAAALGPELGAFAGGFVVALASNAYARWRRRPPAVVLVPAMLLLVPGSIGFLSLNALMERQALAGIETAFSMMLTAVALVAGLLIAGVIAPEPRLRASPPR
ncbi:threonine/serine ThrE exporter family protein [Longimicrobium sp.]|uniref:threonine/serine ThrE exporter family protein n=1 Tax=Longimicrobium sp. TaxID=2029185 RepID=UPI003B3BB74F